MTSSNSQDPWNLEAEPEVGLQVPMGPVDLPPWAPQGSDKALVLRTCRRLPDGRCVSFYDKDFEWPSEPGSFARPTRWDPESRCGEGLHGLLWGEGNGAYLAWKDCSFGTWTVAWSVVEVALADVVRLHDKVKFSRCRVVYQGDRDTALALIYEHSPKRLEYQQKLNELARYSHRLFAINPDADAEYGLDDSTTRYESPPGPLARLFSSELAAEPGMHTVAIDVDHPARLVGSSTPGHFHLYIDIPPIPWWRYRRLLKAMARAGVIQDGYYRAAVMREATMVRLPWVRKGEG